MVMPKDNSGFRSTGPNFWFSLGIIALGILFLLDNLNIFYIDALWDYWPLLLILLGLFKLVNSQFQSIIVPGTLIIIGFVFLLVELNYLYFRDVWAYWPLILVAIGINIIWNQYRGEDEKPPAADRDRLDVVALFGGRVVQLESREFRGGTITTAFGGAEINLANSRLADGGARVDIFTIFGGAEIFVPEDWKLVVKGFPIFGGFTDSRNTREDEAVSLDEQVFTVRGLVMFGGIEIKNVGQK